MNKVSLRSQLQTLRASLPLERREEAKKALLSHLLPNLATARAVLSFVSFGHEIDTSMINHQLAQKDRLYLPRIEGNGLKIFHTSDLQKHLITNAFGLLEPNPAVCFEVNPQIIDVILVPALGFDTFNHRLGYGRGFYDRFLKKFPNTLTIGIGFKEQLISEIPSEANDIALQKVSLF